MRFQIDGVVKMGIIIKSSALRAERTNPGRLKASHIFPLRLRISVPRPSVKYVQARK